MTHPMSALLRNNPTGWEYCDFHEHALKCADELDRLSAIEQEARKHFLTADGLLVMDMDTEVYLFSSGHSLAGTWPFAAGRQFAREGNLARSYSTREKAIKAMEAAEAALAAAKGTT